MGPRVPAIDGAVVAVIQARMGSSRLPGKIMMDLAGAPMLQRLIERVVTARLVDQTIVATSAQSMNDCVATLCEQIGVPCFRGEENDVLSRFLSIADETDAEFLVRVTGDNPFVDGELIDLVLEAFQDAEDPLDYANNIEGTGYPYGMYVEVMRVDALRQASRRADAAMREHVTLGLRKCGQFQRATIDTNLVFPIDRLTVDTAEDYAYVSELFSRYFRSDPCFSHRALAQSSKSDSPKGERCTKWR